MGPPSPRPPVGGSSAYVTPPYVISPLTGIADRAGSAATVTSYSGTDPTQAAAAARSAQVAIVFAELLRRAKGAT